MNRDLIKNNQEVDSMFYEIQKFENEMHLDDVKTLYSLRGYYRASGLTAAQKRLLHVLWNQTIRSNKNKNNERSPK